ncbi:MAG: S-methyl-5-thioribose-1-phosphate isomerase, partial [Planctomycetota bacterium]
MKLPVCTIEWVGDAYGHLKLLNQTKLPTLLEYKICHRFQEVKEAIVNMVVRGAPAIGIAAAFGVVLGARQILEGEHITLPYVLQELQNSRPTAVNLFWALQQQEKLYRQNQHLPTNKLLPLLLNKALQILQEDLQCCQKIGYHGAKLLPHRANVLTHCNAGALATANYGTALGVIYSALQEGKDISVFVDETRPLWQGARLSTWELQQNGVKTTLICDNMAA